MLSLIQIAVHGNIIRESFYSSYHQQYTQQLLKFFSITSI